jgi:hypothetical protein
MGVQVRGYGFAGARGVQIVELSVLGFAVESVVLASACV